MEEAPAASSTFNFGAQDSLKRRGSAAADASSFHGGSGSFHSGYQEQASARSSRGNTEAELLQKARQTLADCDGIANGTLSTLNDQTEQLSRIEQDSQGVTYNLDQSERLLKDMKPWRGFTNGIRSLFGVPPKGSAPSSQPAAAQALQAAKRAAAEERGAVGGYNALAPTPGGPSGGYGSRRHSVASPADAAVARAQKNAQNGTGGSGRRQSLPADEMDKAYEDIDNLLDGLKHKSQVINATISQHNKALDDLTHDTARNQQRMHQQGQMMSKLLNK